MIQAAKYQRPILPDEDELAPSVRPLPPPTTCDRVILFIHAYHRIFTTVMFVLSIGFLLWGGAHGINLRPSSSNSTSYGIS